MPFGWGESKDAYDQYQEAPKHESHISHELLAGGAAFEGFKAFEDHQRSEGKPVSHAFAKEAIAGLAGAFIDKEVESKGLDWIDREKAKHEAKRNAEQMYNDHYGDGNDYDPNSSQPHGSLRDY